MPAVDEQSRVEQAGAGEAAPPAQPAEPAAGQRPPARNLGLVARAGRCWRRRHRHRPDTFLDPTSQPATILTSASVIGVVTVGMTFVIIGGGIDLSVGAIVALAVGLVHDAWRPSATAPAAWCSPRSLVGVGAGLVNGVLIAYGRLVPFIATLAMLVAARGLAEQISGKHTQVVTDPTINGHRQHQLLGIPLLVYIFAAVVAVGWVLLNRTTFGRRTFAIGGNPEAARLAGINVRRHTVAALRAVRAVLRHRRDHAHVADDHRLQAATATSTSWTRSPR